MKKKILAVALATMMVVSSAVSAFAADDVEASGWWVAHSEAIEVTEDGVSVTFHSDSSSYTDSATNNWNTPIYVLYTADEAFAGGADLSSASGYTEYFVARSDLYGWDAGGGNTNDGLTNGTWTVNSEPEDWTTWLSECVAGVDCTLEASLSGSVVTITFTVNGASSTAAITVDSGVTPYISLSGEYVTLTNITVSSNASSADDETTTEASSDDDETTTEAADDSSDETTTTAASTTETGDVTTFAAIAIVVAAAVAIVALKKRVTE